MGAGIQADVANAGACLAAPGVLPCRNRARRERAGSERPASLGLLLIALLAACLAACGNKKATAAPVSPPPPAVIAGPVAPPPELISEPQTTTEIPDSQPVPGDAVPEPLGPLAGLDEPEETVTEPPPQPRPSVQAGSEERPVPDGTEGSTPVPRLGQILTAEERQAYNRMIDRSIDAAQKNLATILGHTLRPDQWAAVRRIRAFIEQARTARERDVALARNLADRALLLAEDLARSFR